MVDLGRPLGNSDEAIYAEFVREMHRSGDFFSLRFQGHELHQRPPTAVALYAVASYVIPGELGLRLLPALFTLMVCVGAGLFVWRWSQRPLAGFTSALFAAAIPSVYVYGRLAFSDPPFVLAAMGAVVATIAVQRDLRWLPWAGIALGAGFAIKSIAAVIPLVLLLPWLVAAVRRQRDQADTRRRIVVALTWFAVLALPYYLYNFAVHGGEFWREHFGRVLFDRASGQLEDVVSIGGPFAYVKHMWRADGPVFSLILLAGVTTTGVIAIKRKDCTQGILASYTVGSLVLLSAAGTRLPHYLLVVYPAAAMCVGMAIAEAWQSLPERYRLGSLLAPVLAVALLMRTGAAEPFDQIAVPAHDAKRVGAFLRDQPKDSEFVFTFNWYAPALGYYADRTWIMLTDVPRVAKTVGNTGPFRKTQSIVLVPPWPTTRGFYLAGPSELIKGLGGIHSEIRYSSGNITLIWAKPL